MENLERIVPADCIRAIATELFILTGDVPVDHCTWELQVESLAAGLAEIADALEEDTEAA